MKSQVSASKMVSVKEDDGFQKEGKYRLDLWSSILLTSVFLISGGFVTSAVFMVTLSCFLFVVFGLRFRFVVDGGWLKY